MTKEINLGSKVKDIVSGFTGIATQRTEYLNGCVRYAVDPGGVDKDGKPRDSFYFDVQQLVVISEETPVTKHIEPPRQRTGGPGAVPKNRMDPPKRRV